MKTSLSGLSSNLRELENGREAKNPRKEGKEASPVPQAPSLYP